MFFSLKNSGKKSEISSFLKLTRPKPLIPGVSISFVLLSKSNNSELKDLYNTEISKFLIEPMITKVTKKTYELLNSISIDDVYKLAINNKNQHWKKKKVDFVI